MRIPKFGISLREINIEFITALYCVCIIAATFIRWMNYFNLAAGLVIIVYIFKTRRIGKSLLCIFWSGFIFIYPICDAALRGESGLSLFTILCYTTPLLMLLLSNIKIDNFASIFIIFVKGFTWFQAFGVFLERMWERAFIIIAWRLLGFWSYGVTGFSTDATTTAYIISLGVGLYLIEYWLHDNKMSKYAFIKLICGVILLIAMILTNKRSFLVAVFISILFLFLMQSAISRVKFCRTLFGGLVAVFMGCCACTGAYYVGMSNALGRMGATLIGLSVGEDVTSMRSTWAAYMNEWRRGHEMFGIGWESFVNRISYTSYGGRVPNGHNVYRQVLCEEGYVGLIVFVLLLLFTIVIAINNVLYFSRQKEKESLYIAMFSTFTVIVFFIYSYSGNAIYDAVIYLYFFASVQLVAILQRKRTRRKIQERGQRELC